MPESPSDSLWVKDTPPFAGVGEIRRRILSNLEELVGSVSALVQNKVINCSMMIGPEYECNYISTLNFAISSLFFFIKPDSTCWLFEIDLHPVTGSSPIWFTGSKGRFPWFPRRLLPLQKERSKMSSPSRQQVSPRRRRKLGIAKLTRDKDMALAHNILIRGLNSIYRQAPYVKPEDERSFLGYAKNFVNVLKVHHDGEETSFFPACDKMAGEAGVMEKNAQQHAEFHDGLVALQQYIIAALEGKEKYDGDRIVMLIDGFGKPLSEHLAEEIQTILDLKRFGPERMKDLLKSLTADGQANLVRSATPSNLRSAG